MKVGSLVECIYCISDRLPGEINPVKGKIYTVRGIERWSGMTGMFLEEIINPRVWTINGHMERSFCVTRFRELLPPMSITIEQFEYEKA